MLNTIEIRNAVRVVGVRQPSNPDYAIIDAENQESTSGLYVTDNPNCKIEYLKDTQDNKDISDEDFNLLLKRMQESSVIKVCNQVFNKTDFIDRKVLYQYAQNKVETETLQDGLITHKISVSDQNNIAFEITRVILGFEGSGDIELMLFNTSKPEPIKTSTITITDEPNKEVYLNWKVDNSGDYYKGDFYIGYLSGAAGLGTLKPYKRDYDNSNIKSSICQLYIEELQFIGHNTNTLPDLSTSDGLSESTGLNLDITVYKDYTDLVKQNKYIFAEAINYQFQIDFINVYVASLRSNIHEKQTALQTARLIQVIEGTSGNRDSVKVTGLLSLLNDSIVGVRNQIEKLNEGYFGGMINIYTVV